MTETNITMDDLTTENLDRVAKKLQEDSRPSPDNQKLWDDRLVSLLKQLVDHFEDGNDVIIQAKLGDQLPRMFEKMPMRESGPAGRCRPCVARRLARPIVFRRTVFPPVLAPEIIRQV